MTIAFALGAFVITVVVALATLVITRQILLNQREDGALRVAISNAQIVSNGLSDESDPDALAPLVAGLNTTGGARALLNFEDTWHASNAVEFGETDLPEVLLTDVVEMGQAARMRSNLRGEPVLLIAIPIPNSNANYFESVPLDEIQSTLRTLSTILAVSVIGSTIFAAALGYWASRQALRPLRVVTSATEAIAEGQFDTRLEPPADRDLAILVTRFNSMAAGLEERIERDARFASEVSHELRSPLMTLTASIEVLENSRDELTPRAATALDLLSSDIDRFRGLVEDLLEISRFDAGQASLQLSSFNAAEFLDQIVAHDSPETAVDLEADSNQIIVTADKRRMARIMSNLLANARTYAGGATSVQLGHTPDDETFWVAVEDAGPGVDPTERSVIFERFSRGSGGGSRDSETGMGLGLAMVTEDAALHGGSVEVQDRTDGKPGARFVVTLPVRDIGEGEYH